MAIHQIAEVVLASSTGTITFSSIPSTYRDLMLVGHYFGSSGTGLYARLKMNNATTPYSYVARVSQSSGITGGGGNGEAFIPLSLDRQSNIDATPSVATLHFLDYARSGIGRHVLTRLDTPEKVNVMGQGYWNNTAVLNRIDFILASGSFSASSRFTLWGVDA